MSNQSIIKRLLIGIIFLTCYTSYSLAPFAREGQLVGSSYAVPENCAVDYKKTVVEKLLLFDIPGKVVGHIEIKYEIYNGLPEFGVILELEVSPEFQRGGFGSLLFQLGCYRLAHDIRVPKIIWTAAPYKGNIKLPDLVAFYKKNGGNVKAFSGNSVNMFLSDEAYEELAFAAACPVALDGLIVSRKIDIEYEAWLLSPKETTFCKREHCRISLQREILDGAAEECSDDMWDSSRTEIRSDLGRVHFQALTSGLLELIDSGQI